ncbi:MAG: hypothetical protein ACRDD2_12730, partial [Sarcina sp.]
SYLLLRNLEKVRGEISLAFFTYNLKRVIKIRGFKKLLKALTALTLNYFLILSSFLEKSLKKRYPSLNKLMDISFFCTVCRGVFIKKT